MILIFSLLLGGSLAFIVWVFLSVTRQLNPDTLRRLEHIKKKINKSKGEVQFNFAVPDLEYKYPVVGIFLRKFKISSYIREMIFWADVNWHVDTFIFLSFICMFPCFIFLFTPYKLMALFGFATLFIPTMYLNYKKNKRFLDFSKQFPDALTLMASSLRAGHPLVSALNIVTDEMPLPICKIFESARKDISLGIDTKDAFLSMIKMMPQSIDLRFFITAVVIQKEVGGNLAELLDELASLIRERFKLMGQLRVQTAQTRLSGMVIGTVPAIVLVVIFFMDPEYVKPLFTTSDGKIALVIAIFLIIAGFISIKKISTIEF